MSMFHSLHLRRFSSGHLEVGWKGNDCQWSFKISAWHFTGHVCSLRCSLDFRCASTNIWVVPVIFASAQVIGCFLEIGVQLEFMNLLQRAHSKTLPEIKIRFFFSSEQWGSTLRPLEIRVPPWPSSNFWSPAIVFFWNGLPSSSHQLWCPLEGKSHWSMKKNTGLDLDPKKNPNKNTHLHLIPKKLGVPPHLWHWIFLGRKIMDVGAGEWFDQGSNLACLAFLGNCRWWKNTSRPLSFCAWLYWSPWGAWCRWQWWRW